MSIEICNFFVFLLLLFSFDLPLIADGFIIKALLSSSCKCFFVNILFFILFYIYAMRVRAHYAYVQKKDWHVGQPSNYYFLDLELRTISAILKNIYIKSE